MRHSALMSLMRDYGRREVTPLQRLWKFLFSFNTLRHEQYSQHFPDIFFKCIFLRENICSLIPISLKFDYIESKYLYIMIYDIYHLFLYDDIFLHSYIFLYIYITPVYIIAYMYRLSYCPLFCKFVGYECLQNLITEPEWLICPEGSVSSLNKCNPEQNPEILPIGY